MNRHLARPASAVAVALVLGGCSSGDSGDTGSSSDASKSSSASSSESSTAAAAPSPELQKAADEYKAYAVSKAAQAAFAPSRQPWERIEPIAELVENTDAKTDSRVDDFSGVDDPAFTGWHRIEYYLFEKNTTEGAVPFADQLDKDIADLKTAIPGVTVEPINVSNGAAELIEEVSQGKLTGEEDRYSKTDLWDFDANLQGSQVAVDKLSAALSAKDPALLGELTAGFSQIFDTMRPLRQGNGWVNFCIDGSEYPSPTLCPAVTVQPPVVDALKSQLAGLSEKLSTISGVLGLK